MENMLDFYRDIEKIKHTKRNGWKKLGVSGVTDTIASHSLGASLLGWVMAEKAGLDSGKIVKMLAMHDLIMSKVDDMMPEDKNYQSKRDIENKRAEQLLADIPSTIKTEFNALFLEYQEEKTEESRFARECDKLDTLFQAYIYSEKLGVNKLKDFAESYRKKIISKAGKEILEMLEKKADKII